MTLEGRLLVLGSTGMLGSAICEVLDAHQIQEYVGASSEDGDLRDPMASADLIRRVHPTAIVLAAARVGGIVANNEQPVQFFDDNIMIQSNVLRAAHASNVQRLMFIGSSCTYPRDTTQPMNESQLWTGPLEVTNRAFAAAKLAGYEAVEAYRRQHNRDWTVALMTSLYGPRDNFGLNSSHVVPAIMRKMHEAKQSESDVTLWGTGSPRREFMFVQDAARAVVHLLGQERSQTPINVGVGRDISIRELSCAIAKVVGYEGRIQWDASKPDGTPRKLLDVSRLSATGFRPQTSLDEGLAQTYEWMLDSAILTTTTSD